MSRIQLKERGEERDDDAVKRNPRQYWWRNNPKERHEPFTAMTRAVPTQPRYENEDVYRDLE